MRHATDPGDPYAIVSGRDCPPPALARDRGKRFATLPKPEHNPSGGTIGRHSTLADARARNAWARTVRGWQA